MPKRSDINLIPAELQEQRKVEEARKSFNFFGVGLFILLATLSLVIFFYSLKLRADVSSLAKSISREQQKIKDLSVIEGDADRLKAKSDAAEKILKSRSQYSVLLDTLSESIPKDVSVTNFATVGENKIGLSGNAQSYVSLANFILTALDPNFGGKVFSGADLTSVSLDEITGRAKFSLVFYLKSGALLAVK